MKSHPRIIYQNVRKLFGVSDMPYRFKRGEVMSVLEVIENAFLLTEGDTIIDVGPMSEMPDQYDQIIDLDGKCILPAWCDSHTHIVFAAPREKEFVYRIKGMTYEEIGAKGGGILNSARKLQGLSEDELFDSSSQRLEEVMSTGTGAIEIKSGYGLTLESELKMLRVIQRLKEKYPIPIKATFLGAHAFPTEYKQDHESYLKLIINEMLPAIEAENLADYCDVFCDSGYYSPEETDRILKAARKHGLKPKIHANQLAVSGGVQVGVSNDAISVDHLERITDVEIDILRNSNTIPTALPSCSFFLNIPYAPARRMIDKGLGLAIATDFNPGSTPSGKMPFLISLACLKLKMLPEEAINAATINGACAMELEEKVGTISKGKLANFIITKEIPSLAYLPYAFGSDNIDQVILAGKKF